MTSPATLPIGQLVESRTNPRRVFDKDGLTELAASAAVHGILEPLLVRPLKGKTQHEIVAGARRYRAAKIASLAILPVRVMELTDQQVLEIQLIENLQREDPHPLEEAEGYARLLKIPGYNADGLAEKVGKDRSYIYKRIQLTELIEPLKGKFLEGKIHIGHALQICRLQEADQIMVAKEGLFHGYGADKEVASVDRLRDFIEREVFLKLSAAPWDRDDAELLPAAGSCTNCQKRTGANLVLFDDTKKDDRCLDRKCFAAKQAALIQVSIAKAGEKGVELIRVAKGYRERHNKHGKGVLVPGQYEEAVKSKCAKPESAIIVAGEDIGRKFQICRTRGCKQHGGYRSAPRTKADVWRDKEHHLPGEINDHTNQRVALAIMGKVDKLGEHETRAIARELLEHLGDDDLKWLAGAVGFDITEAAKKKRDWRSNPVGDAIRAHVGACPPKTVARLIVGVLALDPSHEQKKREDFEHPYKVDRKKIGAAVSAELKGAFRKQKAAALAAAKKPKPAAGKKAKAAK